MKASKLQKGVQVQTSYAGRITQHEITERRDLGKRVLLRVFPPVPKSTGDWIGADHFRPTGRRMGWKAKAGLALAGALMAAAFWFGLPQVLYGWAVLEIADCNTSSLAQSCR